MGALYLASKLEECPLRIRDLANTYDLLLKRSAHRVAALSNPSLPAFRYSPMSYFGSSFYELKDTIVVAEMQLLKRLGFNTHVVLPYGTLVNYMRVLGLTSEGDAVTHAWGYLNDAYVSLRYTFTPISDIVLFSIYLFIFAAIYRLRTPVYALYAVPTIVSAAILLTTRFMGIALPSEPSECWWELFDTDWEDMWSVCGYIMRLYRPRSVEDEVCVAGMLTKQDVRTWLENNGRQM